MKRTAGGFAAAALAAAVALGSAGAAGAAIHKPTKHSSAKNQLTVTVSCTDASGNSTFNGNALIRRHMKDGVPRGRWFVAHVVAGKKDAKVLVPTAVDATFTFTDASGNVSTTTENFKKKARAGRQDTCTLGGGGPVDQGTLSVSGSVTGAFH